MLSACPTCQEPARWVTNAAGLPPVTRIVVIAPSRLTPTTGRPTGVPVRRSRPLSSHPYIPITVPHLIAVLPDIARPRRRDALPFDDDRRRTDVDVDSC